MEILVYITADRNRVLGGSALSLFMPDGDLRQQCLQTIGEMLEADVLLLDNGDHMVLKK